MKERPILFNGEMVRAILDGRKTQTRRIVKPSWLPVVEECMRVNRKWVWTTMEYDLTTPYGEPGDRLWVREKWGHFLDPFEGMDWIPDRPFRPITEIKFGSGYICNSNIIWAADGHFEWADDESSEPVSRWKPSIHMPRWASRINLEITKVRVERLNDISEEDARAEGVEATKFECVDGNKYSYQYPFQELWSFINGFESWKKNPWVWVIEFRRIP